MKSRYNTSELIRELLNETGKLYPLVKAGYLTEQAAFALQGIALDAKRIKDYEKQRNRAINESLILLASIEEDFFPYDSREEYAEYLKRKYKEYKIEDEVIAYPMKRNMEENDEPWV